PAERLLYLLELASDAHLQFHFQIRKRLIEQENIRVNHPRRNLSNTRRNHYCAESDSCWTKYPMVERRNAIGRARIKGKAKKVLKRNGQTDERVHHAIYAAIISHQISPGTALQEDALAGAFGVSRTIIRKVLQRLSHERLVDLVPNKGASVAQPSAEEAREVFEARRVLERIFVGQ